jgi:hypothetical protein
MQQIPEPLELVHDDEVGLQRVHAGVGQLGAEPGDQAVARAASSPGDRRPGGRGRARTRSSSSKRLAIRLHIAAEALDDALVDAFEREIVLDGASSNRRCRRRPAAGSADHAARQRGARRRWNSSARSCVDAGRERRSKVVPGVRLMKFTLLASQRPLAPQLQGNERHAGWQGQLPGPRTFSG